MILILRLELSNPSANFRLIQDLAQVKSLGFPVIDCLFNFQTIYSAHHLVDCAEAELSHDLSDFPRDKGHEVDSMRRIAGKVLTQSRVLCRDSDRAGIQMADPHHDAAQRHQGRRCKTEFFCSQHSSNNDVAASL